MSQISVIVPVYKVEPYLGRCVDSILNQTFADFELILVDDGSPDNCPAICDEYAGKDSRIKVIHKENGGLSSARNAGIDWVFANSDSRWLFFLDSDDWIHKQALEILLNANLANHTKVSCCFLRHVSEMVSDDPINDISYCIKTPKEKYIDGNGNISAFACGQLFALDLFDDVRFPAGMIWEDIATTYKIFFRCESITTLNLALYYYFDNMDGICSSAWTPKKFDLIKAYEQILPFFQSLNDREYYYRILASYCFAVYGAISIIPQSEKKYRKFAMKILRKNVLTCIFHIKGYWRKHIAICAGAFPAVMNPMIKIKELILRRK